MYYLNKQPLQDDFKQRIKQLLSLVNIKIYSIAQIYFIIRVIIGSIPKELYLFFLAGNKYKRSKYTNKVDVERGNYYQRPL